MMPSQSVAVHAALLHVTIGSVASHGPAPNPPRATICLPIDPVAR
jgi:hypothetical protein